MSTNCEWQTFTTPGWPEHGPAPVADEALAAMVDGGGDLVWFVDPVSFAVAWANRAFRSQLPELDDVAPTRRLRVEDLFPDPGIADRWRGLYEQALQERFVTERRFPFPGALRLDVTVVAVERRGETVGLAVFGTNARR